MPAIFVSHSSRDAKIAAAIKDALAGFGFERVFLDFDKDTGIGAGENWEKRLHDELSRCHAVILVLTPQWLASKWCFAELVQARSLGKIVLPLVCEPLGDRAVLGEIQALDVIDSSEDGLSRLKQRLDAITHELARGFEFDADRSPYPGIHAFESEDAAIYFGRDDETRAVIERLDASRVQGGARLLLVIGASGAGKSSLLKAGVLPQLGRRRNHWLPLPVVRPGTAVFEAIAKAISQQLGEPQAWEEWHAKLRDPDGLAEIERLLPKLRIGEARNATVLLPFDQFEEIFTLATAEERLRLLRLLAGLLDRTRNLPIMVLANGRSDVLESLIDSAELARVTQTYALPPLPIERVSSLVEGPAAVAGLAVEKGLAERIARDVETAEALPLLAHTLWLLWRRGKDDKRLNLADYESLSDPVRGLNPIQNSIRLVADQAIAGAKPDEEELAALRDAFVPHLVRVRLDDGRRLRQPARQADLPAPATRLIQALVEARLLQRRAGEGSDPVVEVAHEALFTAWPTLEQWLTDEQGFLGDIERVRNAREIWTNAPADKKTSALLRGLLLSRARDWLDKYAQRFTGGEMALLGDFIRASAAAEDAERLRMQRLRRRVLQGTIAATAIFAFLAVAAGGLFVVAEKQRNDALNAQSQFLARDARTATAQGNATLGAALALAALPQNLAAPDRPFVEEAELALQEALANLRERAIITAPDKESFGQLIVSLGGDRLLSSTGGNTAILRDAKTGAQLLVLSETKKFESLAFSPSGKQVVTSLAQDQCDYCRNVQVWDAATGRKIFASDDHGVYGVTFSFSNDGRRMVVRKQGAPNELRDTATGAVVAVAPKDTSFGPFAPDGKSILALGGGTSDHYPLRENDARLISADDGAVLRELGPVWKYPSTLHSVFSPDGSRIFLASGVFETAQIMDAASGKEIARVEAHGQKSFFWSHPAFSADNSRLVTTAENTVYLWDANSGALLATFAHENDVQYATFSSDSAHLVTVSAGVVRLWDAASGKEIALLRAPSGRSTMRFAFSPQGDRLLVAFDLDSMALIDTNTGAQIARLEGVLPSSVFGNASDRGLSFSPADRLAVTVARDGGARLWSLETGELAAQLREDEDGEAERLQLASFSADASRVITGSYDTLHIWRVEPAIVSSFRGHAQRAASAAFSPDGSRMVTASDDGTARVWDVRTQSQKLALRGHEGAVTSAAFSPDGRWIVTASADKTARIWDAASGTELRVLDGHTGAVRAASFSPDGKRIVTASDDKTARIWDAASGKSLLVFREHDHAVQSAEFSPDGTHVLSASTGKLLIWDAASGAVVERLKQLREDPKAQATWSSLASKNLTAGWNALFRSTEYQEAAAGLRDGIGFSFASYSADGTRVVGTFLGALVEVWDVGSAFPDRTIIGQAGKPLLSARFGGDGRAVAIASYDGSARVWSTKRSEPQSVLLTRLGNRTSRIDFAAFSPKDDAVATASTDGTVRLWRFARCQAAIDEANALLPRKLSAAERGRYFLVEEKPTAMMSIYAAVRPWLSFALPASGTVCE